MTVTGAIASYVLANSRTPILGAALIFPAVMNAGFSMLFYFSISESRRLSDLHGKASKDLDVPEFNMCPLRSVCQLFSLLCGVATLGLLGLGCTWLSARGGQW